MRLRFISITIWGGLFAGAAFCDRIWAQPGGVAAPTAPTLTTTPVPTGTGAALGLLETLGLAAGIGLVIGLITVHILDRIRHRQRRCVKCRCTHFPMEDSGAVLGEPDLHVPIDTGVTVTRETWCRYRCGCDVPGGGATRGIIEWFRFAVPDKPPAQLCPERITVEICVSAGGIAEPPKITIEP